MTLKVNDQITVHRASATTWTVTYNGTQIGGTFSSPEAAERLAFGLVSNAAVSGRGLATKAATAEVQVITLTSFTGTDSFALKDPLTGQETIPFVRGTNAAATDVQTALRTLTGDTSLTVTGDTDEGPFTVTWVDETTRQAPLAQGTVSGCTLATTVSVAGGVG